MPLLLEEGHIKKFCQQVKKDQEKNKGNMVRINNSCGYYLSNILDEFNIIYGDNLVNLVTNETSWVINSGMTVCATSRKEFISFCTQ